MREEVSIRIPSYWQLFNSQVLLFSFFFVKWQNKFKHIFLFLSVIVESYQNDRSLSTVILSRGAVCKLFSLLQFKKSIEYDWNKTALHACKRCRDKISSIHGAVILARPCMISIEFNTWIINTDQTKLFHDGMSVHSFLLSKQVLVRLIAAAWFPDSRSGHEWRT